MLRYNRNRARGRFFPLFSPRELFYGSVPGAWYDPTDLSTMFQDSTGTTPVTAVEQPVGLILDKSQGLALGSDIVVNGNFASAAGWLTPGSWTIGSGVATASGNGYLYRTLAAVSGYKVFRVTFDLVTRTAGSVQAYIHNGTTAVFTPAVSAPGSYSFVLANTNVNELGFLATALTGSVDNLSIRELAGNHASQSTAASRPTYRARYNLLTYSEQFNDASWTKLNATISANAAVAPDGTTTADKLIGTTAVASHWTGTAATIVNATSHTVSIYAKAGEYSQILMYDVNVNTYVAVDLSNGAVTSATASTYSVTPAGNGWYRISITAVSSSTSGTCRVYLWNGSTTVFAGDGTSGILIWGAQLLTAADVTATGNAYQRVAAATVYDTAPIFRPYLAFDGMDDSLSTAAINFTSTDKMTVFAGLSKLNDAVVGAAYELSGNVNTNAGSFAFFAPGNTSGSTALKYFVGLNASTPLLAELTSYAAPDTSVVTLSFNNSAATAATQLVPRVDTATPTISYNVANAGTGNFGNYSLFIGRRNNTSFPFNGRVYELIVRGAASSTTEIIDTEQWVNQRTGAF